MVVTVNTTIIVALLMMTATVDTSVVVDEVKLRTVLLILLRHTASVVSVDSVVDLDRCSCRCRCVVALLKSLLTLLLFLLMLLSMYVGATEASCCRHNCCCCLPKGRMCAVLIMSK